MTPLPKNAGDWRDDGQPHDESYWETMGFKSRTPRSPFEGDAVSTSFETTDFQPTTLGRSGEVVTLP
jgi:hypothetical protein